MYALDSDLQQCLRMTAGLVYDTHANCNRNACSCENSPDAAAAAAAADDALPAAAAAAAAAEPAPNRGFSM